MRHSAAMALINAGIEVVTVAFSTFARGSASTAHNWFASTLSVGPSTTLSATFWSKPSRRSPCRSRSQELERRTEEVDRMRWQQVEHVVAHVHGSRRDHRCVKHHLVLAGRSDTFFSDDALVVVHQASRGLPREVNNLALQALVATFAKNKSIVDESAARMAVVEVVEQ